MMRKMLLLLGIFLAVVSCSGSVQKTESVPVSKKEVSRAKPAEKPVKEALQVAETVKAKAERPDSTVSEVTFFAIGDVLFHSALFKACEAEEALCDFRYVFAPWKSEIQKADIAVVNQETIFVSRSEGYSSYPNFGTPEEVGLAELDAGFDIVTHATNHTIDRGEKAVDFTLDFWKDKPVKALGIHATKEARDSVFTLEKNGIRFAFVNFTYGLNGQKLPAERPYLVDLLDSGKNWIHQVERAEAYAEVTVAFLHFGTEYTELPTKEAMRTAEMAIDAGADILVCAHPHVVEPFGVFTTKAGNRALVYWSLGNFVSNQQQLETNLGGVARFTVKKTVSGGEARVEVSEARFEGSVTQQEPGNYHAIPLELYTNELAERHLLKKKLSEFSAESLRAAFQKALDSAPLCETEPASSGLPLPVTKISNKEFQP